MLPRVKIYFENGALGSTAPSDDGVVGLVASGVAVAGKFELGKSYLITKVDALADLGITADAADANACIYKAVAEFYTEAQEGTKLWIFGVAKSVSMADMFDPALNNAKKLIEQSNGAINILMVAKADPTGYTATIEDGLDSDVYAAAVKAQALGVWAADVKFAPVFSILEGRHYAGVASELMNLHEGAKNRVCILVGDSMAGSTGAAVGLLAGRCAAIPVQRSIARVKSGAIAVDKLYIADEKAEDGDPDLIHDAGFITFRTLVGKAGYFFSDDKLATAQTDDYALIPRRRMIDKAYRIAYKTLIEELGDEIPVTSDGGIPAPICKSIQNAVEVDIENNMTANGNLGADPSNAKDTGVVCYIDPNQNVVGSSKLSVQLRVKPFGYAKYIDLYLGFKTVTN